MRAFIPVLTLLVLALAGCGSDSGPTAGGPLTGAQQAARVALIKANDALNDLELAHLCPALYPQDVIADPKKYSFDKQKAKPISWTKAQIAQAQAARCGKQVPFAAGKAPGTVTTEQKPR